MHHIYVLLCSIFLESALHIIYCKGPELFCRSASEGLVAPPDDIELPVSIAAHPRGIVLEKNASAVRFVSDNYWKLRVPKHLAELPRLKGLIQDIMADPSLKLDLLPSQSLASHILERANQVIRALSASANFKIGLTSNPVHRWHNTGYGYVHSSNPCFTEMRILGILASTEGAAFMEASLIDKWQSHHRCLNKATGGEGVPSYHVEGPFCVYAVSTR